MWRIIMMCLWLLGFSATLQAQSYERLWQRVEQLEEDDLPKSVIEAARTIYVKAEKERNVPQMMKAFLTMAVYRKAVSPDSLQVDMRKLEEWASAPQTPKQDKAVLSSILGELTIRQDFVRGDSLLKQSLKDSLFLVDYNAGKFVPLVKVGETSRRYFDDNLYELLARRAIEQWKRHHYRSEAEVVDQTIRQTYQSLLSLYKAKGNRPAWLLTALDAFPFADEAQLKSWLKEYNDLEVCAEVYQRLASEYIWRDYPRALALLREAINRYPHYTRINALKNMEKELLLPYLHVNVTEACPNDSIKLRVDYRNLTRMSVLLYKVGLTADSPLLEDINEENVGKYATLCQQESFSLEPTSDYKEKTVELKMKAPSAGIYYAVLKPIDRKGNASGQMLYLTGLQIIQRVWNRQCEFVVVDKQTGHPIPNAQISFYDKVDEKYIRKESYTTNEQGTFELSGHKNPHVYVHASINGDEAMKIGYTITVNGSNRNVENQTRISLFTDRGIYRPGQRVYYAGIAYSQQQDSAGVVVDKPYTVSLRQNHRETVGTQEVKSDAFGTFSGEFQLPASLIPGRYYIEANKERAYFRVEEYKRPTFEVVLDTLQSACQLGDSVKMEGVARTYSGVPLSHAVVKYQVKGMRMFRSYPYHTASGETTTDGEGRFTIPVHFAADEARSRWRMGAVYEITAEVTSLAGETQVGTMILPVGKSGIMLTVNDWSNQVLLKEKKTPLKFTVVNSMDVKVSVNVSFQVFRMKEGKRDECVWAGDMPSNTDVVPEQLYALPSGEYMLEAVAKGENAQEVSIQSTFAVFSLSDRELPYKTDIWSYQTENEFDGNRPVDIYFGSSRENVYLLYDVYSGDKCLESKRIVFSDSLLLFRFPYKEEYGDGIKLSLAFVKNGRLYRRDFQILKPQPEKKLVLSWKTFRNKLLPGQKETWTLKVHYPDGTPADAQLLAGMYDASLEQFVTHDWNFNLHFQRNVPFVYWNNIGSRSYFWGCTFPYKRLRSEDWVYSVLNLPEVGPKKQRQEMEIFTSMGGGAVYSRNQKKVEVAYAPVNLEEDTAEEESLNSMGLKADRQFRSDFAETAFFYPRLRTDEQGEIGIEFSLPESLTEWKFMGLAHTKEMDYGRLDATATASKDFMLQPNLPRFVRVGDEASLAATLMNLTEKEIRGTVRMELFNPATDKIIKAQKKSFQVRPKETVAVSFSFSVKESEELLACRMVAEGNGFSDGEQRYLPVLTNKRWMTESVSLDTDTAGTYRISLDELFNHHSKTVSQPRMTVEYTGNPVWYVVQALPVLSEPETDNVYAWAAACYANVLASHIVQSNPQIRQVVEMWKGQSDKEILQSPLLQDQDLKGLLLEESPWMLEAKEETERIQRLSTLFDENAMTYRMRTGIAKLKELQNEEGAWSWYKGMSGNRYMTTQVTELLARLQFLTGEVVTDKELAAVYRKAFGYLKKQVHREYEDMKQAKNPGTVSEQALRYLYICALDPSLQPEKQINEYLVGKLNEMSGTLTIYGKALAAIVLQRNGQTAKAGKFLQSVMEYSVFTAEMGRYFDTPKASYTWFSYKIPTQVAAMEAVRLVANEEKTQEEMKRWLLRQKQTQQWKTPIATVDAVYALLCNGRSVWSDNASARIEVGEEVWDIPAGDSFSYLKKTVAGEVRNIREITIEKEADGVAWGAVYVQYLENVDRVAAQSNGLSLSRSLYRNGKPVAEDDLSVGDKVTVRLTVSSERDMDFVQVKDERASCLEPADVLSAYRWKDGMGYYQVTKDASTSFFFDRFRKGTYTLEYEAYVTLSGEYRQGLATVQSVYAPEHGGHSDTTSLKVK